MSWLVRLLQPFLTQSLLHFNLGITISDTVMLIDKFGYLMRLLSV